MKTRHRTPDTAHALADHLDHLVPPGRADLADFTPPDPALLVARQLAAAPHPVMADERVSQLEALLLTRAAAPRVMRRQIARGLRWIAAAVVLVVMAATLVIGIALLDHEETRVLTPPGGSAYDTTGSASQPVTVRETRESSVFIIPSSP